MGRIWSDQRRYETWLLVEIAAAEAMAAAGIVPPEAARDIRERGAFDIARIEEIEQITQHDVIAFTTAVAEKVGPSARWLHFGLTSSDVIDTAQALQMREACDLILDGSRRAGDAIRDRAVEHRRTPMIGRTHGVHAEPMTLRAEAGAVVRGGRPRRRARAPRARDGDRVGKLSGAVGTFAHLPPSIEADVCRRLGLEPAPVASQVIQRDRHAELLCRAGDHRRVAREVRARDPRSAEDRDRRGRGAVRQGAEGLVGDAAQAQSRSAASRSSAWPGCFAATAHAAFENIALWHERDISHSSVERVILPDSFIALDHMLRRFTRIVRGMVVQSGAHAREPRALARRGVFRHGAARAREEGRVARAGVRMGAAQRDALVRRAARLQGAAAGRPRRDARADRRPRSSARSISTSSSGTSTIFDRCSAGRSRRWLSTRRSGEGVTACARVCSSR